MNRKPGIPCPQSAKGVSNPVESIIPPKPNRRKQQQQYSHIPQRCGGGSRTPACTDKMRQRRPFSTNYSGLLKKSPPPMPPSLIKGLTNTTSGNDNGVNRRKDHPGPGKVKIMLRMAGGENENGQNSPTDDFLRMESNKKHVSVFTPPDPATGGRSDNPAAPKVYAFDSVFTHETTQSEICSASLVDVIQAVLNGADGTVFCYGQAYLGKTYVLAGSDNLGQEMGVIPCAISWLFRCIGELQEQQGSRFTVSVSAIEVYGTSEKLRDLLTGYCEDPPPSALTITEDPLVGTQIENRCEIQASTSERAGFLLDAALASRSCSGSRNTPEARRHSHVIFSLNLLQHRTDKNGEGSSVRSRLHFIDLGSCDKNLIKTPGSLALSYSSLGHVIMAIVNNSKHVPFRQSKLTCVLRDTLGNINCRAVMLAHVSRDKKHYADTVATIQLASRIHRVLKKKNKVPNGASAIGVGSRIHHPKHLRHRTRDDDSVIGSSSGMECTSGSELSCDTVVYVNRNGVPMSDRELTDNEGPPESVPVMKLTNGGARHQHVSLNSPTAGEVLRYNVPEARVKPIPRVSQDKPNTPTNPVRSGLSRIPSPNSAKQPQLPSKNVNSRVNGVVATRGGSPKPQKPPRSAKNSSGQTERVNDVKAQHVSFCVEEAPKARRALFGNDTNMSLLQSRNDNGNFHHVNQSGRAGSGEGKGGPVYDHASYLDSVFHCDGRDASHRPAKFSKPSNGNREIAHNRNHLEASENYPTAVDHRQEPDGCDHEAEVRKSIKPHVYENVASIFGGKTEVRPDSMLVNVDDCDWRAPNDDVTDEGGAEGEAVDINFYCLTLTSLNPLVPVSRRKFAQEVKRSKQQKGSLEQQRALARQKLRENFDSGREMDFAEDESTRRALQQLLEAEKTLEELVLDSKPSEIIEAPKPQNNNNVCWDWKLGSGDKLTSDEIEDCDKDEELAESDNLPQMPKLECDYYSRKDSVSSGGVESPQSLAEVTAAQFSNQIEPSHRQVCLYATNSLEMNYVSTQSRSESPARSRGSPSPSRKLVVKDSDLRRRTSRPIIITKSTSKEGAQLTLVKKDKGSRPTLELQITREEVQNEVDLSTSKIKKPRQINRGRKNGISADPNSHGSETKDKTGEETPKRSKWSGLRRFGSKRSESKPRRSSAEGTSSPSRSSIVSKLLTPKVKRASSARQTTKNGNSKSSSSEPSPRRQPDVVLVSNSPVHSASVEDQKDVKPDMSNGINGHDKTGLVENGNHHQKETSLSTPASSKLLRKKSSMKTSSPSVSRFGFSRKSKAKT
uniref:Uncharacterized protein LOC108949934 n=1 Tax=Phallusia mammillata TaxID=59560 RepID=A0A6F9DJG3_9ASCI|nr:uncharacterized protein LOC108949934 [Phallusia mammillata]